MKTDAGSKLQVLVSVGLIMLALLLSGITGCASFDADSGQRAGPGQAVYHYRKSAEGCEVVITSAREVPGIEARVDENCAVTVKAEALSGEKLQLKMMGTINMLSGRLLGAP